MDRVLLYFSVTLSTESQTQCSNYLVWNSLSTSACYTKVASVLANYLWLTKTLTFLYATLWCICSLSPTHPLINTHTHTHLQPPVHDPSTTSPVTSYVITYEEGGTGNSQQRIVSSTTLNVTLEGLKKGTQYEVSVTPFNEVGEGKTSQSVAETAVDRKFM